jgi:hypothetical protein
MNMTVQVNQRLIVRTTDQSANCFSKTDVRLESRVRSAHIIIPNNVGGSFREVEQSMDVKIGTVTCCIQKSATTGTSLDPVIGLDAKKDTPRINKCQRKKLMFRIASLFYGRNKSKSR